MFLTNIRSKGCVKNRRLLLIVPDELQTQEMRERAVEEWLYALRSILDFYKTQKMSERVVLKETETLKLFLMSKKPKMCERAVADWWVQNPIDVGKGC